MNDGSSHPPITPELEARVVAMLLGEASEFERDELDRLMKERPQLAEFKQRVEQVHELIGDVVTSESGADGEWKLSDNRRSAVLAVINEQARPAESITVASATRQSWDLRQFVELAVKIAALLCVAGFFGSMMMPPVQMARRTAPEAGVAVSAAPSVEENDLEESRDYSFGIDESVMNREKVSASEESDSRDGPASSLDAIRDTLDSKAGQMSDFYLADDVQYYPLAPPDAPSNPSSGTSRAKNSRVPSFMNGLALVPKEIEDIERSADGESGFAGGAEGLKTEQKQKAAGATFGGRWRAGPVGGGAAGRAGSQQAAESSPDSGSRMNSGSQRSFRSLGRAQDLDRAESPSAGYGMSIPNQSGANPLDPTLPSLNYSAATPYSGRSRDGSGMTDQDREEGFGRQVEVDSADLNGDGDPNSVNRWSVSGGYMVTPQILVEDEREESLGLIESTADQAPTAAGQGVTVFDSRASLDSPRLPSDEQKGLEKGDVAGTAAGKPRAEASRGWYSLDGQRGRRAASGGVVVDGQATLREEAGTTADKTRQLRLSERNDNVPPSDSVAAVGGKAIEPLAKQSEAAAKGAVLLGETVRRQGLDEKSASEEAFSTFSLHVSDVSFKLARSALASGQMPDPSTVRIEEFVNAFDYGDPLPGKDERVACRVEQSTQPFLQQRNLLRVSLRTAAAGRSSGTPLRLTFLLDNSGSMERLDRQQTVRRAFALLARQLTPIDRVTLISFARQPRLLADHVGADQAERLVELIESLPSEGGTNMESALKLAFEKAREHQLENAQNRIILLTDGAVNLGDADPESLASMVESMRHAGIAFDAAGISAEGLNDEILEALTRQGDGRYYLLDSVDSADEGFVRQVAGALRPSAMNVKVQVEFNPERVGRYKLLGFEKHRLKDNEFRDDRIDAAEMAAEEAGVAVYQFEARPEGAGDVGSVSVRFRDMSTGQMIESRWPIPYESATPRLAEAAPSMRIAATAALLAAKLRGESLGETVDLKTLSGIVAGLPQRDRDAARVQQLQLMIQQARQISEP